MIDPRLLFFWFGFSAGFVVAATVVSVIRSAAGLWGKHD
jgi:hypothetical protein